LKPGGTTGTKKGDLIFFKPMTFRSLEYLVKIFLFQLSIKELFGAGGNIVLSFFPSCR
jgi:hypothetical protein